ncbi:MAG: hypothetical protein A3C93_05120 [Candidatus Lloydbacteria bacterium RIFCSPHIGHO2_02_FULL_54_17]|uniref:SCP domain-containing protein n=1 Tax=Candidatus Lloydbacteria bacterium RIFCSPHIGHO2_02_FULL_54_17 TaxID=1798664 RepID=A0A1G2DCD6_9BACT|nr:MAG: hypothetical protein A2762_00545 [Candidatus Lloydbacteria bacterium RIFCSPHIGHO2_01_FULL_54_11]OGZ11295.1 MAG: hypothetical protein A3C93_05120 [Candidatus Lloydbacteria bacterium RIFCSPHIGHO2_02_FULL_54_17]OGZ13784.1 MAG: hypothetical protein A2948_03755 [Candidatus Lloydbacteria bacterium RIFCSPLOWO2_01_FULL_54_18]OGZ16639.1 MAG: hypothetical protein A3H76_04895 [Candidatus Lloydbacteria bacterium RIFCSPLOWO2_02_FULL_54_12]
MGYKSLCFVVFLVVGLVAAGETQADITDIERRVFEKTNQARAAYGAKVLLWDRQAEVSARGHAEDMAKLEYMAHQSPTEGRRTPPERNWQARISAVYAGENVFRHSVSGLSAERLAANMVDWWMDSPGHRANILNPEFTHMAIGGAYGSYQGWKTAFVAQTFLRRVIIDPRLTIEGSQGADLRVRISGRIAVSLPYFILWDENGKMVVQAITPANGVIEHRVLIPKTLGAIEVHLGVKNDPSRPELIEVTDRFLLNTQQETIYPPPH